MKQLIQKVISNIDPDTLDLVVGDLKEAATILNEVEADIDDVKPQISFWDRVNVFNSTDQEKALKEYQKEQQRFSKEMRAVTEELRRLIRLTIEDVYVVRLKVQLSEVAAQVDQLRAINGESRSKIRGKTQLIDMLVNIDLEYSAKFNLEQGPVEREELVELVLREMLRRRGII